MLQPVRLKRDQLNEMTLAYLRSVLKQSFFKAESMAALTGRKVLLTVPKNLSYERYVMKFYQGILEFLKARDEKETTLIEDLDLLVEGPDKPVMSFQLRMAITFRSDQKKIVESQIHIIKMMQ